MYICVYVCIPWPVMVARFAATYRRGRRTRPAILLARSFSSFLFRSFLLFSNVLERALEMVGNLKVGGKRATGY